MHRNADLYKGKTQIQNHSTYQNDCVCPVSADYEFWKWSDSRPTDLVLLSLGVHCKKYLRFPYFVIQVFILNFSPFIYVFELHYGTLNFLPTAFNLEMFEKVTFINIFNSLK